MRILVACEFSGIVRDAFRAKGHDAWSCDILPTDADDKTHHIQGDAIATAWGQRWDMMIAHPPCTFMANSSSRHLYNADGTRNLDRWDNMRKAATFFWLLLHAPIRKKAIENPIMLGYAKKIIGSEQSQIVHPHWFGHGETKATCLWLVNLPLLVPTNPVPGRKHVMHELPPGPDRWKLRSTTYTGVADAMAEQWGVE